MIGVESRWGWLLATVVAVGAAAACSREAYDPSRLPSDLRSDYHLFALRCSKCHALARPLGSGIEDDAYWRRYVERMRLQPGSGISVDDEEAILRFLHYYSTERKRRREGVAPESGAP